MERPPEISLESYDAERRDFDLVLAAIRRAHSASPTDLENLDWIEEWVSAVGLGNLPAFEDAYLDKAHLVNGSHQGIVQYPREFARWLRFLAEHRASSYLEIGCYNGATACLATAYLHRFNPAFRASTIDLYPWFLFHHLVRDLIPLEYCVGATSFQFRTQAFDAVFIDADHGFPWAWADYENAGRAARITGLHDIRSQHYYENEELGGVTAVWELIKRDEGGPGITFHEIAEHPAKMFGIGIRIRDG